ncbi:hypothetical protein RSAG8_09305, partial [Rhizoctonia solani AG-8 WAC10335]
MKSVSNVPPFDCSCARSENVSFDSSAQADCADAGLRSRNCICALTLLRPNAKRPGNSYPVNNKRQQMVSRARTTDYAGPYPWSRGQQRVLIRVDEMRSTLGLT